MTDRELTPEEIAKEIIESQIIGGFVEWTDKYIFMKSDLNKIINRFSETIQAERSNRETMAKELQAQAEMIGRMRKAVEKNRNWWESLLKHRHDLSEHDLHHQIDVCDEALKSMRDSE